MLEKGAMAANIYKVRSERVMNFLNEKVMNNFIEFFRKFYSKDIYFLMSFPRSGNGWIRYLITEALLISNGIDLQGSKRSTYKYNNINAHCIIVKSGESYGIEDYFPDYYAIDKEQFRDKFSDASSSKPKKIYIKTHHLVFRNDVKVVHLYRNPKDACISYFNLVNLENDKRPVDVNSEDFVDYFKQSIKLYLQVYCKILNFYLDKENKAFKNILLLKMEDMVTNSAECFDRLLSFLKIKIADDEKLSILKRNPKLGSSKNKLKKLWDDELDSCVENFNKF